MKSKVYAILLAGGSGTRMNAPVNKILLPVRGIPCIARSAAALAPFVSEIVLVGRPNEKEALMNAFNLVRVTCPIVFVCGGSTRQASVFNGLQSITDIDESAAVLIHDGARCLVSAETISAVLSAVLEKGSGVASVPVTDTLRSSGTDDLMAGSTLPRDNLFAMQTPQGFRLGELRKAFSVADQDGFIGTDDAAVMAHAGFPVYLTPGSRYNIKLTTWEDYQMAEALVSFSSLSPIRVGFGYDVHQLTENRRLILCGVDIPYEKGLLGHSDADVALHALMDALLGAAGLGDIGKHFPDSDNTYLNIDSMKLLDHVMNKLAEVGYVPSNVDITIVAQKPKLAPYIRQMTENLASAMHLPLFRINVKATTTEHLGFEGRMEGISAYAVCLIQSAGSCSVNSSF